MGRWLYMLGGLVVWTAHFLGVYGIASIAEVMTEADVAVSLWAVGGLTLACVAADVALGMAALRRMRSGRDQLDLFVHALAALAAGLSLVAVIWQGLPVLTAR